jgi:D-arabinose 1-dehydrogenase-like Zn-dependent alcohol dehydrogenase
MRAVVMRDFGAPDVLRVEEVSLPEPAPGEARVRVGAVEVARTRDLATRSGNHPFSAEVSLPHVLGGDFAGIVDAVGEGVSDSLLGRYVAGSALNSSCGACQACFDGHEEACSELRMLGIHSWGSYADYTTLAAESLRPLPDDMSPAQGAALAAAGPIAYAQLELGRVREGTWVLVTGAGGSLGSTLVALAVQRGARVIAVSRKDPEQLEPLGAYAVVDAEGPAVADRLDEITGGEGVEVVVDNVTRPEAFMAYMPALTLRGRVVISGAISQEPLPLLPLPLYVKSQSILGMRTANRGQRAEFWDLVDDGFRLPEQFLQTFALEEASAAHESLAQGAKLGHYLLETGLR